MAKPKLIAHGAEAKIYLDDSKDLEETTILKHRISKPYRHETIDKQIIKRRTKREEKILKKAKDLGINVPTVWNRIGFDLSELRMSFIDGDKLSQTLNGYKEEKQFSVMQKIGEQTAKLHDNDIIHGDLTTSNIILQKEEVYIIDFGLGQISKKIEDKAVDLHLIKQALEAKHFQNHEDLFEEFLKGYKPSEKKKILERLAAVEKRGRYRH